MQRTPRLPIGVVILATLFSVLLLNRPALAFDYGGPLPVLALKVIQAETTEPSITSRPSPARMRVVRSGNDDPDLTLVVSLRVGGTATVEKDYAPFETLIRLTGGQMSHEIVIVPLDDDEMEGPETVTVGLEHPPFEALSNYVIDTTASRARVIIHDNDVPAETPAIRITQPLDGDTFPGGQPVKITARAWDPRGYVPRLEFFAGEQSIGVSQINFIVAPDPGTVIEHEIEWSSPPEGAHVLTARATLPEGEEVSSPPVSIRVTAVPSTPVVSIRATGWRTAEPNPAALIAPGQFTIERTSPLEAPLRVFLSYDGTATYGVDYPQLPLAVEFAPGEARKQVLLLPYGDDRVEGLEVARAKLMQPIAADATQVRTAYRVNPDAAAAMVVIGDDDHGGPDPRLDIIEPESGRQYPKGAAIHISALGIYSQGEIDGVVEFYAGDKLIGKSSPLPTARPPIPGRPNIHSIVWDGAPEGTHVLTARYEVSFRRHVVSPPVRISVGHNTEIPTVSIVHIKTRDVWPDADHAPGYFLISRTGPTHQSLAVSLKIEGTAVNGVDYRELRPLQVIPAGEESLSLKLQAIDDKIIESDETVRLTLIPSPPILGVPFPAQYRINPDHASAELVMFDNDRPSEIASLDLVAPKTGSTFELGATIRIVAVAVDKLADIRRVEFFDGNQRIGISEHFTRDAVIPGRPREHVFEWVGAGPGDHELFACALDSQGDTVLSQKVQIKVTDEPEVVMLSVTAIDPRAAELDPSTGSPDPAVFRVHRVSGPKNVGVSVFFLMGGAAVNGVDYERINAPLTLPAGAESVDVTVKPISDKAIEGDEVVVLTLLPPLCPAIYPPPPWCYGIHGTDSARAVIVDHAPTQNLPPKVDITRPISGTVFPHGQDIPITAIATDADGFIRKVEFFAGREKIGEIPGRSELTPAGGILPAASYLFVWKEAPAGKHVLTARATDDDGAVSVSAIVEIEVSPRHISPVVTIIAWDAHAVEPRRPGELNTATFQIRRSGPVSEPLDVLISVEGTATEGRDYEELPDVVVIPAGRSSVFLTLTPIEDDEWERSETVVVKIQHSPLDVDPPPYVPGRPSRASAVIVEQGWIFPPGNAQCIQLPGGLVHLCFPAAAGERLRIEASEDLGIWQTIAYAHSVEGAAHHVDEL
ncbi:MAG: hypothetical protein FJ405_06180, partial [Verrucomicrobia bacterium]|nr:hypothetical protein [Verrucomicrobiota bacterium]